MATRGATFAVVTAVAAAALLVAGCGGGGEPLVVRTTSPATTGAPTAPTTTASSGTPRQVEPKATVRPSTNLTDGQVVTVTATGFSPNQSLVVTECADKGTKTTSGDCNLESLVNLQIGASGSGTVQLRVAKGPFGTNRVVCGQQQPCLVSVTQPTPSPQEEADVRVTFR